MSYSLGVSVNKLIFNLFSGGYRKYFNKTILDYFLCLYLFIHQSAVTYSALKNSPNDVAGPNPFPGIFFGCFLTRPPAKIQGFHSG